jgi:hypothetical protein
MKKIILMLSFIIGISVVANAQDHHKSPEQRAQHMTRRLTKMLKLSQEQAAQVNTVFMQQATRMDSLKSNMSADRKANHLTRRSIMLSTKQQVVAVLNDSQKQQFMAWEKMRKERHKEKRPPVVTPQG